MNKLFTKIAAVVLGATMATGVGVAVASGANVNQVHAASKTVNYTLTSKNDISATDAFPFNVSYSGTWTWSSPQVRTTDTSATVTFSGNSSVASITKIEIGCSSSGYAPAGSASSSYTTSTSSTTVTISGSGSTSVVWTPGASARLKTYKITYNEASTATLSSIALSGTYPTTFTQGDTFSHSGMIVTATYSDSTTADVTSSATWSGYNMASTGNQTVTVSYTEGETTKTATYNITVNAPKTPASISSSGHTTTFDDSDIFAYGGTLTVTYTDSTSSTVSPTSFKIGAADINPLSAGTVITPGSTSLSRDDHNGKTVYVLYTENSETVYTSYVITVNAVTEVTFTYGTDNSATSTLSKKGVTLTIGTPGTDGTWDTNSNNAYKVFKNKTLQVSGGTRKIDRIVFTGVASYAVSNFNSYTTGSLAASGNNGTWTGSTTSVTFTAGLNQVRMTEIVVHFETTTPAVELNHDSIDLKTTQSAGLTVEATVHNVASPTYSWVASNANVTLEDDDTAIVTIKPNTNVAASSTVTLTVGGITPSLTASVTVSITVPGKGEVPETAFTVAEARAHIDSVVAGGESSGNDGNYYYAAGIVSQIVTPYDSSYHNISYNISADGTTSGAQLEAYRGKGIGGANFTSEDDLLVGDQVIIYGQLKVYNSTYEFDAGNYLYSLTPAPRVNSITLTPSIVTVAPEDAGDIVDLFSNITINQDTGSTKTVSDIEWSSSDTSVFYISNGEYLVEGAHKTSATLSASIDGKVYGSATIEVVDPSHPFIIYDNPVEWTIVSDASTLAAGDKVILTGTKSEVTYAASVYTGSGNNVPADTEHALTVSGDNVTGVQPNMIYTLETGSESGSLAFKGYDGKYLYAAGGTSNNYMKSQSSIDGNASFILNADGTVVAQGTSTHNYMRYNNSSTSNLFSCYGSTSTTGELVTFYKQSGGDSGTIDLDSTILTLVQSHMATYQDEHGDDQYGIDVCDYYGSTLDKNDWDDIGADFTASVISTYKLNYARSNVAGNDVEKFLSAYDYVVEKYGADYDFLGRIASGKVTPSETAKVLPTATSDSANAIIAIVIVSVISVTAIGGYFFLRKRREQN